MSLNLPFLVMKRFLLYSFLMFSILACSPSGLENDGEYIRIQRNEEIRARVAVNNNLIKLNARENQNLKQTVSYQVVLIDEEVDSILYHFPEGDPPSISNEINTEITYDTYGRKKGSVVLTKIDTTFNNNIIVSKDTMYINSPEIMYDESNWSSYTLSNTNQNWLFLTQSLLIDDFSPKANNLPEEAIATFSGFSNKQMEGSIEFCIEFKNSNSKKTLTRDNLLEITINDELVWDANRLEPGVCYKESFRFKVNEEDFDLTIRKYPTIATSNWTMKVTESQLFYRAVESNTSSSIANTSSNTSTPNCLLIECETYVVTNTLSVELYELVGQNKIFGYYQNSKNLDAEATLSLDSAAEFIFGSSNGRNIKLGADPIPIRRGENKITFNLEQDLPTSYLIEGDRSNSPKNMNDNEELILVAINGLELKMMD